jgi:integrase/recombinase XerD
MAQITRLDEALVEFANHLDRRPISDNTRKAFWGDVNIFARYMMPEQTAAAPPLRKITAEHVREFLAREEKRANANSPKSIERRLTSVKVFFRWLREQGHIAADPADAVPYKPLVDPLPEYLTDAQTEAVIQAGRDVAAGEKLDTRPLAVIYLVLDTGIKKSECLNLCADDIERNPRQIFIHYDKKHLKFKERLLPISADCLAVLDTHIERFGNRGKLFDCTGRNLEYIFNGKVAPRAGIPTLTFEMLRWTSALKDFRADVMDDEQLQEKYGLSALGWSEMEAKLARIVQSDKIAE